MFRPKRKFVSVSTATKSSSSSSSSSSSVMLVRWSSSSSVNVKSKKSFLHRKQQQQHQKMLVSSLSSTSSSSSVGRGADYWWSPSYESTHGSKIRATPEYKAMVDMSNFLRQYSDNIDGPRSKRNNTDFVVNNNVVVNVPTMQESYLHEMSSNDFLMSLDASIATFLLHVNARIASMCGVGYYTIGPCGEELLSGSAMSLQVQDSTALHYRHTAISIARQLKLMTEFGNTPNGTTTTTMALMKDIVLNRARAYTVSRCDPVTGGVHCSIGGGINEYVVTSTLSSQCPSAVGRALGYALLDDVGGNVWKSPDDDDDNNNNSSNSSRPISFVTIGDGSLHNHHFLSSLTLARHAKYMNIKCPIVFGISDNGMSISYKTRGYVDTVFPSTSTSFVHQPTTDPLVPVFRASGQDMLSVYDQTKQATEYARKYQAPCVLLYKDLVRRFGHAATDRQDAYLDTDHIQAMADTQMIEGAMRQAVEVLGYTTYSELRDRYEEIQNLTDEAFQQAVQESKVTLEDMMSRVNVPLAPLPIRSSSPSSQQYDHKKDNTTAAETTTVEKPQVMRKHMTRVLEEALEADPAVVYLGEDVRHGGYYLVTEGLAKKYPKRIIDFPPDETTLLGSALGFAQLGLIPIVEIPYAKYLDCGVDMFYEIAIQHWLNHPPEEKDDRNDNDDIDHASWYGQQQQRQHRRRGMIIRLQGFDRGVFGGNFHTHNSLAHMPPGVDVVCFSNGKDYVRGFRHALWQAKHGRIVMLVDCTHVLNLRHVHDKDRGWETYYPSDPYDMMTFDECILYRGRVGRAVLPNDDEPSRQDDDDGDDSPASVAIVSYGNGVVTSLQARKGLVDRSLLDSEDEVDVIDCPYLSNVGVGLENMLTNYDHVLFADICKAGPGSNVFSSMITTLHQRGSLPPSWSFVGAPRTYNPLGSTVTFLNQDTIEDALIRLLTSSEAQATESHHIDDGDRPIRISKSVASKT